MDISIRGAAQPLGVRCIFDMVFNISIMPAVSSMLPLPATHGSSNPFGGPVGSRFTVRDTAEKYNLIKP